MPLPDPPRPESKALRDELDALRARVIVLEMTLAGQAETERETMRAPAASSHDWDVGSSVDRILTDRVKDPRDRMTSDRARAIATQVVEAVRNADDARELHVRKDRAARILGEILAGLVLFALGVVAAKLGWRQ